MSYSLELEATSSIHMNSSAVRAAADAVTRLALDDSLHQSTHNHSASTDRRRSSPSPPPPPPPDDVATPRHPPAPSSRSPSAPPLAYTSSLPAAVRTSPSQPTSHSPQSLNPAPHLAFSSPASRYPSFDQWLTIKESSFNFGAKAVSPPLQSTSALPRRPATASSWPSLAKDTAAALAATSNEISVSNRVAPGDVLPQEAGVDDPQQLYMRAVALQQVLLFGTVLSATPLTLSPGAATHPRRRPALFSRRYGDPLSPDDAPFCEC